MAPPQPKANLPDLLMHKNQLQEYAQKSALQLPVYQTTNEGFQHAPQFRATVVVEGRKYTATKMFSNRKEAEQEVAKYAFECIMKRVKDAGCDLVYQDTLFCKSILVEFAVKMNLDHPKYTTTSVEDQKPVFVSSLVFHGKTYTGEVAGSKKVAEQLAARAAIQSLLGSSSGTVLSQIIKAKEKHYASLVKGSSSLSKAVHQEGSSQQQTNISHSFAGCSSEGKNAAPSCFGKHGPEMQNRDPKKMRVHEGSSQQQTNISHSSAGFSSEGKNANPSCVGKRGLETQNREQKKMRIHAG